MPLTKSYVPEEHVAISGVKYNFVSKMKLKSGQTKEYYRCEFCSARLHVFKDTMKCQLISAHTSEACTEALENWESSKPGMDPGAANRLESIMEETVMSIADLDMDESGSEEDADIIDLSDANLTLLPSKEELDSSSSSGEVSVVELNQDDTLTEQSRKAPPSSTNAAMKSKLQASFSKSGVLSPIQRANSSRRGTRNFVPTPGSKRPRDGL